jgi:hypothetical protein
MGSKIKQGVAKIAAKVAQPTVTPEAGTDGKATAASSERRAAPSGLRLPSTGSPAQASQGQRTPKTPQDEAISFFSKDYDGEPVQVWELELEDDGGPGQGKSVGRHVQH